MIVPLGGAPSFFGELLGGRADSLSVTTGIEVGAHSISTADFGLGAGHPPLCPNPRRQVRFSRLTSLFSSLTVALIAFAIPALAQPQADFVGTNITGQFSLARIVNLRQQAGNPPLPFAGSSVIGTPVIGEKLPKVPPRLLRPGAANFSTLAASNSAAVAAPPRSLSVSASSAFGFNALSHLDQRNASSGNQFSIEPSNQSIAVGNGYVLEGVNNAVQVYTSAGAPVLQAVLATNQVFGVAPAIDRNTNINGVFFTDMRVYFDGGINRWFILQRAQDNDASGSPLPSSHMYMAVSKTNDPAGDYLVYVMDTTNASHPGCPCIADYPQIGSDQYGFHIAWNEFNAFALTFVDASVVTLSKAALSAGATTPTTFQFLVPFTTGYEFALQPATTSPGASNFLANGGVEYFVSSSARPFGTSGMALWSVRNTSSLGTPVPFPVLSRIVFTTLAYSAPDVANQRPGPLTYGSMLSPPGVLAFLDGGDARIQSLTYASGRLFLTLQTAVQDANNRFVVGAAYVVLSPVFRSGALSGSVLNQGYLMVNGNHLLRPYLAVNAQGRGAIAVTLVGPDWFPTAALIRLDTFGTPGVIETAALGTAPEDGFTGYPQFGGAGLARWGDYNGAVAAADGSIWMVTQYIGNHPRTTFANWNTYVANAIP